MEMNELLEWYQMGYRGQKLPPEQRFRLLYQAQALVEGLVDPCPWRRLEQEEALRWAICAAAEALYDWEQGLAQREQNGDLSVSYQSRGDSARQLVAGAIYPYLCGTGLLYRGRHSW